MKTILLTGGSGFVGRNIKESFLASKYEILAPTRNDLDLLDERSVVRFFDNNRIDVVIHSACKPSHRNARDMNDILRSNTLMFFNLERYSSVYEKLIVLGSGAIYNTSNPIISCKEDDFNNSIPLDEHGFGRYICGRFMEASRGKCIDLRIFGIFGKYEDYSIRFISNMICKSLYNLPLTIIQNRMFSYLYVDDLMPILDYFISHPVKHASYNITSDERAKLYSLAQFVNGLSSKKLPIISVKEGMGKEYTGDNTRLKEEYSEIRFTPIHEAIQNLYAWYSDHISEIDKHKLLVDK